MLAAHGAPDQRAVAGVEFLDAAIGLDDLGAGHRDTARLGHGQRRAAARDQAAAAIAAGATADQADDLHARRARLDHRAHDLGDGELAGIGLLQPHAAGIEQDQHGHRLDLARGAQQTHQLGAMHLAEGAAHEAAFLRGDEHRRAVEPAAPDDDAVVELLGKVEYLQVRADLALFRPDELDKAAGIEQQLKPRSRRCLVEARAAGPFRRS